MVSAGKYAPNYTFSKKLLTTARKRDIINTINTKGGTTILTKRQAEILKDYFVMKLQSLVDDIEKQIDSLTAPENGVVDIDIEDFSVNDTN